MINIYEKDKFHAQISGTWNLLWLWLIYINIYELL